jgi:ligand-binding SRPBCC domain-containing protein
VEGAPSRCDLDADESDHGLRAADTVRRRTVPGPFRSFHHEHRFESVQGGTRMHDDWRHEAPLGLLGSVVDRLILGRYLRRQLLIRNREVKREAEARANDPAFIVASR